MIKWTRKKSLWPILSVLGCLFVLAVVAPQAWHRYQTKHPTHKNSILPIESSEEIVTLQPERQIEPPQLSPAQGPVEPELPPFEVVSLEAESVVPTDSEIIPPALNIPPAPPEPTLAKPEFDFEALLHMRDSLLALVERLPRPTLPPPAPSVSSTQSPTQVRVANESDRLAMLDRRDRPSSDWNEPNNWNEHSWAVPTPEDNVASIPLDEGVVGKLIEDAQQASEQPTETPQLARQDPAPVLTPTLAPQPTPTPQEITESTLVPLPPIQEPVEEPTPPREPLLRSRPNTLFQQLDKLSGISLTKDWAEHVHNEVALLSDDPTTPPTQALAILDELETLAATGRNKTSMADYSPERHHWLQAIQSLERRLAIWHALLDPAVDAQNSIVPSSDSPELLSALSRVADLLEGESYGAAWRSYLQLDQIATATSAGAGIDQLGRSKLAQTTLLRMDFGQHSLEQQEFLASEPLRKLRVALQPWAATSVNIDRLAALIERYETGRELRFAVAIAQVQQQLRWSNAPQLQALADHLDLHYRGSNVRLAVTDDLMNQMIPEQKPKVSSVNERIAGAKVRGKSRTTTELRVQLIPDAVAWRLGLEARGNVYSKTRSDTWPASVRNAAKMQYQVRKFITISQQGLQVTPAKAQAQGRHDLLGVDSQLDPVPLLGGLLREIARNKNQQSRPKAISQVKRKVVQQAQQRMDTEADAKFENLEQKFRDNVLGPIGKLALIAEPRSMFTTEDRAVMQLRLANTGQLAAHTPRPLAPADSLASMQMHETVLNNALAGLKLDGQRMKVTELFEFFAKKFGRLDAQPPADLSPRAVIQFAKRDAILINCDDDRVELVLNIREVAHGRDKIRNFQVHAYFRPVLDGLDVRLVRVGSLQFAGSRIKTGARIVLHGVFGKLLEKDAEIGLMADKGQVDPRLNGLMITQLVINDGWLGLAIGPAHPERTAWRTSGPNADTMMR